MKTCETSRFKNGVLYVVTEGHGKTVWARFVRFGKQMPNRAGGAAFVQAAREQEKVAGPERTEVLVNRGKELFV